LAFLSSQWLRKMILGKYIYASNPLKPEHPYPINFIDLSKFMNLDMTNQVGI